MLGARAVLATAVLAGALATPAAALAGAGQSADYLPRLTAPARTPGRHPRRLPRRRSSTPPSACTAASR